MKARKLVVTIMMLAIASAAAFAGTTYIGTNERILIVHDDGTWENLQSIEEDGTSYEVWNNVRFENYKWDSTNVVKVGKFLQEGFSLTMTMGCYYRLEMSTSQSKSKSALSWEDPVLMLSDGSIIEGFSEKLSDQSYSIVFDVPDGLEPINVGFTTSNSQDWQFCYISY
ncbi:MAG: hypothetical protein PHI83_01395 [Sphaerochaetaceae bacterium]|nr:hypothetical protein [Sphaerochaetaceae bacterium]